MSSDEPSLFTDRGAPDPEREERTQTVEPIQPQQEREGERKLKASNEAAEIVANSWEF